MLAAELRRRGHDVTWWSSNFDHVSKTRRFPADTTVELDDGVHLHLLDGGTYRSNVSLARIRHNREIARAFARQAQVEPAPDVMFVCVPTLELGQEAVRLAGRLGVPCIADVRDRWPDIYLTASPAALRPMVRALLGVEYRRAGEIFRSVNSLVAVSEEYLHWAADLSRRTLTPADGVYPIGFPQSAQPIGTLPDALAARVDRATSVVTFAGTFGSSYDLETVIDAAREFAPFHGEDVLFVLAGSGDRFAGIERRSAGLPNVALPGWLVGGALGDLLRRSTVGLAAYHVEATQSLPNKLFEYWAAGLPVVNSLGGEARLLVDANGLGVNYVAGDVGSLTGALTSLLQATDAEARRRRVCAFFAGNYAEESIYPRLADHIEATARN
jgi:glycosyltransferase involved in cell wall biosynthesis